MNTSSNIYCVVENVLAMLYSPGNNLKMPLRTPLNIAWRKANTLPIPAAEPSYLPLNLLLHNIQGESIEYYL